MIVIEGNTTGPAELNTEGRNPRLTFGVAQNERRKNQQTGEWEDGDTSFWRCTLWGRRAEQWATILTVKNIKLVISGRAKVRQFERQDGTKGLSPEITIDLIGQVPKFNQSFAKQEFTGTQQQDPWASAVPGGGGFGTGDYGGQGNFGQAPPF